MGFDLLTERGHQFTAYYDSERRLTVKGRRLGAADWTTVHPEAIEVARRNRMSNVTGWASHNYLTMALDRDGCLHLSGNMHADPLIYYRTSRPFDLTPIERIDRMTGELEMRATYPRFLTNDAGDLIFRYRDGGSGNGSDLYSIYGPETRAWRRLFDGPLLDGEGERSAYSMDPYRGPDGRFHLLWMWRDTPDAMTNHTLSYARSKDLIHWKTSSGKPLARPLTMAKAEVIDPAKPGEGLINMVQSLGFDGEKRPVAIYHRFDSEGKSQAFVARPDMEGHWMQKQISDWNFHWDFSGGGSQEGLLSLGAPSPAEGNDLLVSFSTKQAGSGNWLLHGKTLELIETLPTLKPTLPGGFEEPVGAFPGLAVRTEVSPSGGDRWVLRWETLGPNRDLQYRDSPRHPNCESINFPSARWKASNIPRRKAKSSQPTHEIIAHFQLSGSGAAKTNRHRTRTVEGIHMNRVAVPDVECAVHHHVGPVGNRAINPEPLCPAAILEREPTVDGDETSGGHIKLCVWSSTTGAKLDLYIRAISGDLQDAIADVLIPRIVGIQHSSRADGVNCGHIKGGQRDGGNDGNEGNEWIVSGFYGFTLDNGTFSGKG